MKQWDSYLEGVPVESIRNILFQSSLVVMLALRLGFGWSPVSLPEHFKAGDLNFFDVEMNVEEKVSSETKEIPFYIFPGDVTRISLPPGFKAAELKFQFFFSGPSDVFRLDLGEMKLVGENDAVSPGALIYSLGEVNSSGNPPTFRRKVIEYDKKLVTKGVRVRILYVYPDDFKPLELRIGKWTNLSVVKKVEAYA